MLFLQNPLDFFQLFTPFITDKYLEKKLHKTLYGVILFQNAPTCSIKQSLTNNILAGKIQTLRTARTRLL
ncbi:MAG: hypothetical protein ACI84K_001273 [Pseudohongiellaceae bacterium]